MVAKAARRVGRLPPAAHVIAHHPVPFRKGRHLFIPHAQVGNAGVNEDNGRSRPLVIIMNLCSVYFGKLVLHKNPYWDWGLEIRD